MASIVGFAGSLRSASYNAALLREAQQLAPEGDDLEIVSIAEIPLYNYDVEVAAYPRSVDALKERIVRSDGLLIATPEYNNSMPGVAKNVIDWLSRPPDDADRVFKNLPVAVMGTSPGRFGTVLAQNAWLSVFRTLEMTPYFGDRVALPQAARLFDEHLTIADELIRGVLRHFIHGFFSFAAQHKGRRP